MATTFTTKVDQHAPTLCSETLPVPASAPYRILLAELPALSSVSITGMSEVSYLPTAAGQFMVDYAISAIYFHSSQAGVTKTIAYSGTGSVLRAADLNSIQSAVNALEAVNNRIVIPAGYLVTVENGEIVVKEVTS